MAIYMTGIDHRQASLDIRGIFSFTKSQMEWLYEQILSVDNVDGCVIISTCNRTEVWLSLSEMKEWDPLPVLCEYAKVEEKTYRPLFVSRRGMDAVEYLFRLAAGLESRILGEDQIVTQVRESLTFARSVNAADSILEVLFRQAVTAAKRAKTEAFLSLADQSVIHTAVSRLKEQGMSVSKKKCMVIGNGMMGRLAAKTLKEQGGDVCVTIRKYHHKEVEIPEGCIPVDYNDRYELLADCDIIVSATSSPHYTLEYQRLENIRLEHPLVLLDLAVPRDISPSAADLPEISLYDVDSFQINLQSDQMKENLQKIEGIIKEEIETFLDWYAGRNCVPQIQQINHAVGLDTVARMIPYLKQVPLEQEEKEKLKQEITGASERMMNHILFSMRTRLKEDSFLDVMAAMQEIMEKPE